MTEIDWSQTEATFRVEVVIPWGELMQFEDGTRPEPQTLSHEEGHEIPDWIIQTRDSAAYRRFWRDRAFEVNQRARAAAEATMRQVMITLGLDPEEVLTRMDVSFSEHPAFELDEDDTL